MNPNIFSLKLFDLLFRAFFFVGFLVIFTSCSDNSKGTIPVPVEDALQNIEKRYTGYIGDESAELVLHNFNSSLFENKHIDSIAENISVHYNGGEVTHRLEVINMDYDFRTGSNSYSFNEYDAEGKNVATWRHLKENKDGLISGIIKAKDSETVINMVSLSSGLFIDSVSGICFDSKDSYSKFIEDNYVVAENLIAKNGGFLVRKGDNYDTEGNYLPILPKGLAIYEFSQGQQIYLRKAGEVLNDTSLCFDETSWNGLDTINIFGDYISTMEIDYEISAVEFQEFSGSKYVRISDKNNGLYVSIGELNKNGFRLMSHDFFLIAISPAPALMMGLSGNYYIKEEPEEDSKNLGHSRFLNLNFDDEDLEFNVERSKGSWLNIKFRSNSKQMDVFEGWIPLYIGEDKGGRTLSLDFNTRGC